MADVPNRTPPDNPLHEEKQKVGQHTSVDPEPKEFDTKTQHGEQSDARKGSQPGLRPQRPQRQGPQRRPAFGAQGNAEGVTGQ